MFTRTSTTFAVEASPWLEMTKISNLEQTIYANRTHQDKQSNILRESRGIRKRHSTRVNKLLTLLFHNTSFIQYIFSRDFCPCHSCTCFQRRLWVTRLIHDALLLCLWFRFLFHFKHVKGLLWAWARLGKDVSPLTYDLLWVASPEIGSNESIFGLLWSLNVTDRN